MARPVTLFTGQFADLPLETLAQKAKAWGYDGLELACWGDHFEIDKALEQDNYVQSRWDILNKNGLKCFAISNHLVGQCICDFPLDERHKAIVPPRVWGDGNPEGVHERAAEDMKNAARAAKKFGVGIVNGFTGSSIWYTLAMFPPTPESMIEAGYKDFANRWNPILDAFNEAGIKFGLEVHPSEIAYDLVTARRTLDAIGNRPEFGFNFDPSHLHWQGMDPVEFIREFPDRIYHVHIKDSIIQLNGRSSILSSNLQFGDPRRGWDFRSPGRGGVKFEPIVRALNQIGYAGPLSVEWEDNGMDREQGAPEAAHFVKDRLLFAPSEASFEAAFSSKE